MSPTLFNLYINDLVEELNKHAIAFGFADDISICAIGLPNLINILKIALDWSKENGVEINK